MSKPPQIIIMPDDIYVDFGQPVCSYCGNAQTLDRFYKCEYCGAPGTAAPTVVKVPRSISTTEIGQIKAVLRRYYQK